MDVFLSVLVSVRGASYNVVLGARIHRRWVSSHSMFPLEESIKYRENYALTELRNIRTAC